MYKCKNVKITKLIGKHKIDYNVRWNVLYTFWYLVSESTQVKVFMLVIGLRKTDIDASLQVVTCLCSWDYFDFLLQICWRSNFYAYKFIGNRIYYIWIFHSELSAQTLQNFNHSQNRTEYVFCSVCTILCAQASLYVFSCISKKYHYF